MFVNDVHCAIKHLFIKRIGGQHVGFGVRMLAEFALKQTSGVDEIVAS